MTDGELYEEKRRMGLTVVALNDARRWGWLHDV
jgi:hypothetical protein